MNPAVGGGDASSREEVLESSLSSGGSKSANGNRVVGSGSRHVVAALMVGVREAKSTSDEVAGEAVHIEQGARAGCKKAAEQYSDSTEVRQQPAERARR